MLRRMTEANRRARAIGRGLGVGLGLALATTLACKTVEQLPAWEEKEPDDAQLAIFEADEPPPDEAASADGGGAAASGAGEGSDDAGEAPDVDEGDEGDEGDEDEGEADAASAKGPAKGGSKGPGPLPKPIYTDIDPSCGKGPGVGQRVKSFRLKTTKGKTISPGSYRNRVVLLNFWGTWCKPCLKELPEFSRLYRRYRKHGLTLVAVATDEDAKAVDEFINSKRISAKVAVGGEGAAGEYGDRTFPFTFVVDGNGVIRAAYDGYKPKCMGKLEADIRSQLEKL